MRRAILVNGVPAAGKSTVARDVARELALPLFALDTVKEALFSEFGTGDRLYNRKMGRGSYAAIWALVGAFPPNTTVVVDAWFGFAPLEVLLKHLAHASVERVCELWCHASPDVIAQRYLDRCGERHGGHLGPEYAPELRVLSEQAEPLAISPVIDVLTERPVDVRPLLPFIEKALESSHGAWRHDCVNSLIAADAHGLTGLSAATGDDLE